MTLESTARTIQAPPPLRANYWREPARAQSIGGLRSALVYGLIWSLVALATLVVIWGSPAHVSFGSPDEASTARAVQLIADTGSPAYQAPFDDPEGIFVQRLWAQQGDSVIPTNSPFVYFLYAWASEVPFGAWLMFVLPAAGLGAFVASAALMMRKRRWLAMLLPGIMFAATFRVLKPWENMAAFFGVVGLAVLFMVLWWRTRRRQWAYGGLGLVVVASSIRPDLVHIVLLLWLIAVVALSPRHEARWWLTAGTAAGAVVVVGVLLSNLAVTKDLFTHPFYLLEGPPGTEVAGKGLVPPFSFIVSLLLPKGFPSPGDVVFQWEKYWWAMGPIWIVTLVGVAVLGVAVHRLYSNGMRRLAYALAGGFGVLVAMFVSRINDTDWGADAVEASLGHSLPRYTFLAYVAVGTIVLVAASRIDHVVLFRAVAIGAVALSVAGLAHLYDGEFRTSLVDAVPAIHDFEAYADELDNDTAGNALFLVKSIDKMSWSIRPTGIIPTTQTGDVVKVDYEALAIVARRALDAGHRPYIFELWGFEVDEFAPVAARWDLDVQPVTVGETRELRDTLIRWDVIRVRRQTER